MDDPSRTESYQQLVADMRKARCSVHVLDHNFNEVDGIITRAAGWANDTSYDLRKANNAARFFHDSQMDETEISEFCRNIEAKLNGLGVTKKKLTTMFFRRSFKKTKNVCLTWFKTAMRIMAMNYRRKSRKASELMYAPSS